MGDVAKNLLKIIIGIILVVGPIFAAITFKSWGLGLATLKFLQGGVVILVILIGLIFLFIGFSDLKS